MDASPGLVVGYCPGRLDRVPYMLVIGQREAEEGTVSVRHRDKDDLGVKPLEEFIAEITAEIRSRSL